MSDVKAAVTIIQPCCDRPVWHHGKCSPYMPGRPCWVEPTFEKKRLNRHKRQWRPLAEALIAENKRLRDALEKVYDRKNQVCGQFEICEHVGCKSSYEAFAIAMQALYPECPLPPKD